ncbi:hypothetical protein AB0M36_00785 [Actinoplanes sp. NPDC051346]|uniref:hypothetical protein n=1 Tax=Actinoplanes sp. NPDC051346 TaxID=3155048 RepID=UPI00342E2E9D
MRKRPIALSAAVALLALAGCSNEQPDTPLPPVRPVELPAASAGGACILWDYPFIKQTIGVDFSVAASGQVDDTSTCVVQTTASQGPYLVLSVVESTKADGDLFLDELMPSKSTKVKGLGKAGYLLVTKASGDHGPTVEIGWLSEADQLQTLQFTFAKEAKTKDIEPMRTKLLALAKAMNTTNG